MNIYCLYNNDITIQVSAINKLCKNTSYIKLKFKV